MKRITIIMIIIVITVILPSAVRAAEKLSTTAIPPRLELEALPGTTLQESLRVRNESATDQAYKIVVTDFIVTGNQGAPIPVDEAISGRWSLASWMTVSPKQILLPAGQTRTVDLIVSIPLNGLAGGHYAMVTYSPIIEGTLAGTGTAINPMVGSLVYLKVVGDVTEAANLKEFKIDKVFKDYGPTQIMAEIENLGDIHLRPAGKLTVTNWLGDETYSAELEEKNIFPFASRTYDWTVPGKWRLGRYAARLTAQAGEAAIPLTGLIYFWIVPVRELTIVIVVLVVMIGLVLWKKRRRKPLPEPVMPE